MGIVFFYRVVRFNHEVLSTGKACVRESPDRSWWLGSWSGTRSPCPCPGGKPAAGGHGKYVRIASHLDVPVPDAMLGEARLVENAIWHINHW